LMFGMSPLLGSMPNVAVNLQKHCFEHLRLKAEEWVEAELFKHGDRPLVADRVGAQDLVESAQGAQIGQRRLDMGL
jgi:hypothetical protein